jgi:hypothetical protein
MLPTQILQSDLTMVCTSAQAPLRQRASATNIERGETWSAMVSGLRTVADFPAAVRISKTAKYSCTDSTLSSYLSQRGLRESIPSKRDLK